MRVIAIHGTKGSPDTAWFRWLEKLVTEAGHEAVIPTFPTPEGQNLANWRQAFADQVGTTNSQDILIGHSVGATFILRHLETADASVYASCFVAGFSNPLNNPEFDDLMVTFVGPVDWPTVKSRAGKVLVYHGDNDPWVPLSEGEQISRELDGKLTVVPGGLHLGEAHGFKELPALWNDLQRLLDQAPNSR